MPAKYCETGGPLETNPIAISINGQAIAMGHPSYSGDLKNEVNGFRVLCLHSIVKQEAHEETVPIN